MFRSFFLSDLILSVYCKFVIHSRLGMPFILVTAAVVIPVHVFIDIIIRKKIKTFSVGEINYGFLTI